MVKLSDIISFFKQRHATILEGSIDLNTSITGGRNIVEANSNEITFISAKYKESVEKLLSSSKAALIVVDKSLWENVQNKKYNFYLIVSDNPKIVMVDCLKFYFEEKIKAEIHPTALINRESKIGTNNFIAANFHIIFKYDFSEVRKIFPHILFIFHVAKSLTTNYCSAFY